MTAMLITVALTLTYAGWTWWRILRAKQQRIMRHYEAQIRYYARMRELHEAMAFSDPICESCGRERDAHEPDSEKCLFGPSTWKHRRPLERTML